MIDNIFIINNKGEMIFLKVGLNKIKDMIVMNVGCKLIDVWVKCD